MNSHPKISPAFTAFFAETGKDQKRDAVIIFQPAVPTAAAITSPRGRMQSLKRRMEEIKTHSKSQAGPRSAMLEHYQKEGRKTISLRGAKTTGRELRTTQMPGAVPMANAEVTKQSLEILAANPQVLAILPNQKVRLLKPKEVDYETLGKQEVKDRVTWGLKYLGIPSLWAKTKGKGVKVAVLDTGVYGDHAALAGRVKSFVVVDPLGNRITCSSSFDAGQHGTHVCGTIAGGKDANGVSIGVAPEADLLVGGVLVGDATLTTLMQGLSWAVENGADIISMSLGFAYYEPLFEEVLAMMLDQYGILPVVAIGNENHGNTSSPGSAPSALAVGAVEKMPGGSHEIAAFSSGASLRFNDASGGPRHVDKPDVAAPGVQVYSCIPPEKTPTGVFDYTYMDGTSMATPHVAGVAALLMAAKPSASAREIAKALKDTALHQGGDSRRPDNRWGYGVVQPKKALQAL
jgi:serine protease AprX